MSDHEYVSSNILFEDDSVDDDSFVNGYRSRIPPPQPKPTPRHGGKIGELERQRQAMLERQTKIEQRTLDSSVRKIGLLRDSEQNDTDTFISEFFSRPAIWDLNSIDYSNRNEKRKAWEEICVLFIKDFHKKSTKDKNTAAARLQRKWKSLRDSFNREMGNQKKSGSGASDRKEYMYFKQLSFLKRLTHVRPKTAEEVDKNDNEEVNKNYSGLEQQQRENEAETCALSKSRNAVKRNINSSENEILKQLSENIKKKYEKLENADPDKDFLMSILPDIHKIHEDYKIDFKGEMLKLIKKYKTFKPLETNRSSSLNSREYSSPNQAGPSSPYQAGPSSPYQAGQSSPYQAGPSSPYQAGQSSPYQAGPSSPYQAGPSSPYQAGQSSPYQAGPSSPYQAGPCSPSQNGSDSSIIDDIFDTQSSY